MPNQRLDRYCLNPRQARLRTNRQPDRQAYEIMPSEEQDICIEAEYNDRVRICPLRRCYPDQDDYWDGNWIESEIRVQAGGFEGAYRANLRSEDFENFNRELTLLSQTLSGRATFSTMEEQLSFTMDGNGRGHIQVSGQATDVVGTGNRLEFSLEMDQTYLPPILKALSAVLKKFPVLGSRDA